MISGYKFHGLQKCLFAFYRKLFGRVYGQNCLRFALLKVY